MANTQPQSDSHTSTSTIDQLETLKRPAISTRQNAAPSYSRLQLSGNALPFGLLAAFLFISFVTVITQAHKYGITIDEPLQQQYGEHVLQWYRTHGKDTSFLTAFPVEDHMPEHGGVFDAGVVAAQHLFKSADPWLVRHTVTGLTGWLGIVAIALCGYELGGPWLALVAAVGLWLYPRYYGAMFNNPKDIPAAVTFTFAVWMTLVLAKHWKHREKAIVASVALGCCMGAAVAIRVTALSWFGVLLALLAGWWVVNGRAVWQKQRIVSVLVQQGVVAETIAASTLASTMLLWPFVFISPVKNLYESVQVLSHYPWNGLELFNGVDYQATKLPPGYLPTWILIGSPPLLLAFAAAGIVVILVEFMLSRRLSPKSATAVLAFAVPVAPLLLLHPVLYDSIRQVLFIIPPLVLIASYGLVRIVAYLLRQRQVGFRWAGWGVVGISIVSCVLLVVEMAALSPYEYAYFSPVIGGIQGAAGKFNTDYYGTCTKAASEWLGQNYQRYTTSPTPTVDSSFLLRPSISPYLPANFHADGAHPDFFIGFTRDHNEAAYPQYQVIHTIAAEGAPLCVIKVNPAMNQP